MNENLSKICRICLTEGSRNIFQKIVSHDALYNVSSLNRMSEKLRYVTLLKIDEMENLPPMICDLCIVQLNVAYNFKRQATESDTKLRQYMIENGIGIMKDPFSLPPPPARAIADNRGTQRSSSISSSSVMEIASTKESSKPVRVLPFRIKVESPETVEPSSEADVLSNSPISPASTVTATVPEAGNITKNAADSAKKKNQSLLISIDSSPASSKGSLDSSGRDSAMVVINSQNVSLQGDEDYVQTILGSSGETSIGAEERKDLNSVQLESRVKKEDNANKAKKQPDKIPYSNSKRMQTLLSSLTIDMVNISTSTKSKLRAHPRKSIKVVEQKQLDDISTKKTSNSSSSNVSLIRRHSLDSVLRNHGSKERRKSHRPVRSDETPRRNRSIRTSALSALISPSKLRSLREKIREERDRQSQVTCSKEVQNNSKRRRTVPDTMLRNRSKIDVKVDSRIRK
ncbi:uncharacterized protein LOC131437245 [Malaya genurostris]|uniref:uncharacterized protein LOC131437245 n=1 Tax=Malaya genurostris TaxID=325434 RepID=UPI0026F3EAFC|nr:uncharacterized protein LOC131437245 [Malaya genurostris]